MRSGQWLNNSFELNISRLPMEDRQLVLQLLKDKLDLEARLTQRKLVISNPEQVVKLIRPHFHESQLYRLERKTR